MARTDQDVVGLDISVDDATPPNPGILHSEVFDSFDSGGVCSMGPYLVHGLQLVSIVA